MGARIRLQIWSCNKTKRNCQECKGRICGYISWGFKRRTLCEKRQGDSDVRSTLARGSPKGYYGKGPSGLT